jgi:hypothetical protein
VVSLHRACIESYSQNKTARDDGLIECRHSALRAISLSRPDGEAAYRPQLNLTGERPATFLKAALKPLSDSKKAGARHDGIAEGNIARRAIARATGGARAISLNIEFGGEGGIRTPDTVARMPHFECGAFNHSATSPEAETGLKKAQISEAI